MINAYPRSTRPFSQSHFQRVRLTIITSCCLQKIKLMESRRLIILGRLISSREIDRMRSRSILLGFLPFGVRFGVRSCARHDDDLYLLNGVELKIDKYHKSISKEADGDCVKLTSGFLRPEIGW